MPIEALERKLNTESDAQLRGRIAERLRTLVELTSGLEEIQLDLPEVGIDGPLTTVVARPADLVRAIGEAAFLKRRDQFRVEYIDKFLQRVGGMD